MFNSPFKLSSINLPSEAEIIFVSDFFADDLIGGAELTSEALIEKSPFKIFKLHSKNVNIELLQSGLNKFWIFGNYTHIDPKLLPVISSNLKYSILEYDYKFCIFRSPEKHANETGACNCHESQHGKIILSFMKASKVLWWMSKKQMDTYLERFSALVNHKNIVLSSVFSNSFFEKIELLNNENKITREFWGILGSSSWVKGTDAAIQHCIKNNLKYAILQNLSYDDMLRSLSGLRGLVFLPAGADTCPRIVIEAKSLGCELILNDNVQHKNEVWFAGSPSDMLSYLKKSASRFWEEIDRIINQRPTISGYITTLNCIKNGYPWRQSIESMLGFCDEVIVVDGGSTDETYEQLISWQSTDNRLKVYKVFRDWSHPRFAVFDGAQKAEARKLCSMDYCWQQDADEIVHQDDFVKIHKLISNFPKGVDLISLPVIEFWGNEGKIRMDVTPWKWRVSRNLPSITHGIPLELRAHDDEGHLYALQGTDGCDYIDSKTGAYIPHMSFYSGPAHNMRMQALQGSRDANEQYSGWFQNITKHLPSVYHYSWYDIERKIKTYKNYWSQHWQSLYNISQDDTAENNMFFDKPWSQTTDLEIAELATRLSNEMSGWVFHKKIDFSCPTPSLLISVSHPHNLIFSPHEK